VVCSRDVNLCVVSLCFFFFQAEDGIRDRNVTGVQTCALPICILNFKRKTALLLFTIITAMVLTACGDDKKRSDKGTDSVSSNELDNKENSNEETQQDQKTDEFYQVEETATVTSREYDFEYEATVNE